MSDSPSTQGQVAALVAKFDAARDTFLAAFAQAPDAALPYTPPGDDYALGVLLPHLRDTINHYLAVYDHISAANYGPVDLTTDADMMAHEQALHQQLVVTKPTGDDRAAMLADLGAAHQRLDERFGGLDDASLTRQADVIYSPGTEPYPTSVADIFGWVIDHYDEHVAQTTQLIAQWQAEQA